MPHLTCLYPVSCNRHNRCPSEPVECLLYQQTLDYLFYFNWPLYIPDWFWINVKIKAWETVFQRPVKTASLPLKSLWKIKLLLKKEGKALPWQAYWGNIYEDPFYKRGSKKRKFCSITNWDVVEKSFLKTSWHHRSSALFCCSFGPHQPRALYGAAFMSFLVGISHLFNPSREVWVCLIS